MDRAETVAFLEMFDAEFGQISAEMQDYVNQLKIEASVRRRKFELMLAGRILPCNFRFVGRRVRLSTYDVSFYNEIEEPAPDTVITMAGGETITGRFEDLGNRAERRKNGFGRPRVCHLAT